ncbi:transmembrane protein [Mycolicibacterium cosmeticum]|uniref:Transmembrane protein n=2 Tax=Mycolicibacterium cosmeticum TaxID=258533 RepID=W9BL11_MYCCO|nr:transmembrane protein [Mycolicibacterium cosmeticum]
MMHGVTGDPGPSFADADDRSVRRGNALSRSETRFVSGLVSAHLLTTAEVVAILVSLSRQTLSGALPLVTPTNLLTLLVVVSLGTGAAAVGGHRIIAPALRWYEAGIEPDAGQRRAAINMIRHQSMLLLAIWLVGGVVFIVVNRAAGWAPMVLVGLSVLFGGISTVSSSLLFTQRVTRPLVAAATREFESRTTAPGVQARLLLMWTLTTALPSVTIALLVVCRANGWFIPRNASVDVPVVLLSLVAVFLGVRSLILVSISISDPLREIIDAMADVEQGRMGKQVDVYEQSEIGRLQSGFNRMVAGLRERDRLRELFGHHVGPDVVSLAIDMAGADEDVLSGDVREVAVLFVDVTGSTQLAMNRTPAEVAEVLNVFFRIVVAAVDAHDGLINKFQGDAALAVFGAPIPSLAAASAALATARDLAAGLRRQELDYGVGVSAGPVFAGNIGAENRYEYTVIGDPVNEAARLADAAKTTTERIASSGAVVARADDAERRCWTPHEHIVLRGRAEPTQVFVPR